MVTPSTRANMTIARKFLLSQLFFSAGGDIIELFVFDVIDSILTHQS